jgi:Leucine Rich repeat
VPRSQPREVIGMTAAARQARRRWPRFRLRSLLLLVAVAGGLLAAFRTWVEPYRRQHAAMATIKHLGGTFKTKEADIWLRRWFGAERIFAYDLQNVVVVDLADCDEPAGYIDHVAALPAIRTLAVGGEAFNDAHLRRLHGLKSLRYLVADCTPVSEKGWAAFGQALPDVQVYRSQRRASIALGKSGQRPRTNPVDKELLADLRAEFFNVPTRMQYNNATSASLAPLWTFSRYLSDLTDLEFWRGQLADADAERLGDVAALRRILLFHCNLTPTAVAHLADHPTLDDVALQGQNLTDDHLASLLRLRRLRSLGLQAPQAKGEPLADIGDLHDLEHLDLWQTKVPPSALPEIGRLKRLRTLHMVTCPIDDDGLARLRGLTNLEDVHLDSPDITSASWSTLGQFTKLRELHLEGTNVGDDGMERVARLRALEDVSLYGTNVSDKGAVYLGQLEHLHALNLSATTVGDATVAALAALKNLQYISLAGTNVTDAAIGGLENLECIRLNGYGQIDLRSTKVTTKGYERLLAALPKCNILVDVNSRSKSFTSPPNRTKKAM